MWLKVGGAKEREEGGDLEEIFCECGDIVFGEVGAGFFEGFGFSAALDDGGDVVSVEDREGEHFLDGGGGFFACFDALKEGHTLDLGHVVVELWFLVVDGLSSERVAVVGKADARFEESFRVEEAQRRTIRTAKEDGDFVRAQPEFLRDLFGAGGGSLASFIKSTL